MKKKVLICFKLKKDTQSILYVIEFHFIYLSNKLYIRSDITEELAYITITLTG